MSLPDYDRYDGLGLAALVKNGDVSAGELLDEAIARTERLNPELNAVVMTHYDAAKAQIAAGLPPGPFEGVPFLLKDLHLLLDGTETTYGSRAYVGNLADHDSTLTERYKAAGLVIFGKTNSPEMGLSPSTEPALYGPTRNPWNTEHSSGGSSGGASAAVAAGILPVAHASDGGGSIRIPASAAGVFGMKPTRGRTPAGPDRGEGWSGMSSNHCVSRTVRDSAALLDATLGFAPGDPYDTPPPPGPYLAEVERDLAPLRFAMATDRPTGEGVDPDCVAAVQETAKLLTDLGHHVEEAAPRFDVPQMARHQLTIIAANVRLALRQRGEALGRELGIGDVEAVTAAMSEVAKAVDASAYAEALVYIHGLGRQMARFHERYDVLLTPVLGEPPAPLGRFTLDQADSTAYMAALHRYIPFTGLANMTGQPAMSMPLHWSEAGLPIGVHFVGRFGEEHTLFRLAGQLERARPWADKRPPVSAARV